MLISGESRILSNFRFKWMLIASLTLMVANMNDSGALFFILMAGLAGTMTLIYFPLRLFLTATARSRRLKLLQRIRKLRDELGQPIE